MVAAVLCVAAPAAIDAAPNAPLSASVAAPTPLDQNLLQNPGFEQVGAGASIPGWVVAGDVHVETFGTKPWPYPAYARKWKGGKRYLTCGRGSGLVRQSVPLEGWGGRSYPLKARLAVDFGGTIGHKIRVAIRATGGSTDEAFNQSLRVLDVTNHYKRAVVTLLLPLWVQQMEATVELLPKDGASKCRMVADTAVLWVFRP